MEDSVSDKKKENKKKGIQEYAVRRESMYSSSGKGLVPQTQKLLSFVGELFSLVTEFLA